MAASAGGLASRLQLAWFNALDSGGIDPNGNEVGDTVIVVNVYDAVFDQGCSGSGGEFLSGVALDFGPLDAGGYYWSDVDLSGVAELVMPGPGEEVGVEVLFYYDTTLSVVGANNQVTLWAPKNAAEQGDVTGLSVVYDDDDSDGVFDAATECVDYGFGLCPDPLGNMVGFFGESCFDFSVGPLVAGGRTTFSISRGIPSSNFAVTYFLTKPGADGFIECIAGQPALAAIFIGCGGARSLVGDGTTDISGSGSFARVVPLAARGLTLWFVAVHVDDNGLFCFVKSGPFVVL